VLGVQQWTGRDVIALRHALRQNKREFARRLGVTHRTIANWENGGNIAPFSESLLDRALANSTEDVKQRFEQYLNGDSGSGDMRASANAHDTRDQLVAAIAAVYDIDRLAELTANWFGSAFREVFSVRAGRQEIVRELVDRVTNQGRLTELATRLRHDSESPVLQLPLQQILMHDGHSVAVVLAPPLEPGMVHRSDDLDAVVALLGDAAAADPATLVAVWGPGGFGKTTLATQVSHDPRVGRLFPEIFWVETGEQCTPARVVQLISDLCVHLQGERPALTDAEQAGFHLARVLGERQALIVIDNVWSATDLSPFLLGGPNCVRLVTTRNLRVCPSNVSAARLGPMSSQQIRELLARTVAGIAHTDAAYLAELCGGWPLLASIVGSNVGQDVAAGAPHARAVSEAGNALKTIGPHALDVWDASQRRTAIGQAIASSLASLDETVSVGGATALRDRYLSLAIFPAATPIPLSALSTWWKTAHGWTDTAVRQFCRLLADRSLLAAYRADTEVIALHDVFRGYLRHLVGADLPALHRSFVDSHRAQVNSDWAALPDTNDYLWRHLPYHLLEADLPDELVALMARPDFVIRKAVLCGPESLVADHGAVEAVPADRADASQHGAALAMTGAAYLLSGLTAPPDIAATLLINIWRSQGRTAIVDELENISAGGDGFNVDWVVAEPPSTTGGGGHVGSVTSVAVHDTVIASGGEDGTIKVWDQGQLRHTFVGHTGWVFAVAMSTDGHIVASAGDDGTIRLWDARTGAAAGILLRHARRIRSLAFTSTGRFLVSGGEDGQVCLWDTDRPGLARTMKTPGCPIWSVAVGCGDSTIAAAGEDEYVRLYDLHSGRMVDEKAAHRDWIRSVAFASDVPILAAGSGDGTASLWQVTGQQLAPLVRIPQQPTRLRALTLSSDGNVMVTAGEDATLRAYTSGEAVGTQPHLPHVDWIRAVARNDRGVTVVGCEDGSIRTWEGPEQAQPTVISQGRNTVWSTAFARNGQLALLGRGDGTLDILDRVTTRTVRTIFAGPGRVWSLAAGGALIGAACGDGTVRLWSVDDDEWALQLNIDRDRTWAVAFNAAGTRLATSTRGAIQLWDAPSGDLLWNRPAHAGERIRSLAFDASGDLLLSGGGDGAARLWDTATKAQVAEYTCPGGWVRAVAISASGDRVAIGYGPGDISVHHRAQNKAIAELVGHNGRPLLLSFTTDPDQLISAAADGTIRSWSLSQQRQQGEVRIDASLHCAAFDSNTNGVLAGSASGVAMIRSAIRVEKG
jgi:WD40 repeat protein/transcriptional regulator with XRE-family HTH domain